MYKFLLCGLLLTLTGCKTLENLTTSSNHGGVIQYQHDNNTHLYMNPDFLVENEDTWAANRLMLGAQWSSKTPKIVRLQIFDSHILSSQDLTFNINNSAETQKQLNNYKSQASASVKELNVNIDGKDYQLTDSITSGYIDISISLLNEMIDAKQCTLTILANTKGKKISEQSLFSVEQFAPGDDIAKASLKKFLSKVSAI